MGLERGLFEPLAVKGCEGLVADLDLSQRARRRGLIGVGHTGLGQIGLGQIAGTVEHRLADRIELEGAVGGISDHRHRR